MAGRNMGVFGPMAASMKEARLEGPVLGEVRPGVGSRGSSGCAPVEESPEHKALLGHPVSPKPFGAWDARRALLVGNAAVAILLRIA